MKNLSARIFGCPTAPGLRAVLGATLFALAMAGCGTTGGSNTPPPLVVDAAQSEFVALQDNVAADGSASITLEVTAKDSTGSALANMAVEFAVNDPAVQISQPPTGTDVDGKANGSLRSTKQGTFEVTATVGGVLLVNKLNVTFKIIFPPAVKLDFTVQPKDGTTNATMKPFKVTFRDAQNQIVQSETRTVRISFKYNPSSAQLSGTLEKAATKGEIVFDDIVINASGKDYILAANVVPHDPAIPVVSSNTFSMNVGAVKSLEVDSQSLAEVGSALQLTVTAKDGYNNIVTNYQGTVQFAFGSSDVKGTLPPDYQFQTSDNGVHDFTSQRNTIFKTAGEQMKIIATDKGDPTIKGETTIHVQNAQHPSKLEITGIRVPPDAPYVAGDWVDFTVTLKDAYDNVMRDPEFEGKIYFDDSKTDSLIVKPAEYRFITADEGTHTFTGELSFKTATPAATTQNPTPGHSFSAAAGSEQGVAQTISNITVVPKSAVDGIMWVTQPTDPSDTRKVIGNVKVGIRDEFGNIITSATDGITISISQDGTDASGNPVHGTLSGPNYISATAGVAVFPGLSIDNDGNNYKLRATVTRGAQTWFQDSGNFRERDNPANGGNPNAAVISAPTKTSNSVTLSWTAVGDDGAFGQATSYDIKYCLTSVCVSDMTSATSVTNPPTPAVSGTAESFTITGLNSSSAYYFTVTVTDNAGNSSTSNKLNASTNACPTGYSGALCNQCANGYTMSGTTCVDLCSTGTNPCSTPPVADCSGTSARTYPATGVCATSTTAPYFTCTYAPTLTNCATTSKVCLAGACITNSCAGITCAAAASSCGTDGVTLTTNTPSCVVDSATAYHCTNTPATSTCSGATPVCYKGPATGDTAACVASALPPALNTLMITEIMHTPGTGGAEWFEIKNLSPFPVSLDGIVVTETTTNSNFTVGSGRIEANGYFVFSSAASLVGQAASTRVYQWPSTGTPAFSLPATGHLTLVKGTLTLEDFTWGTAFASVAGTSMQLSNQMLVAGANKNSWYWCQSTGAIGTGNTDLGTPGQANGDCGLTRPTAFSASFACMTHHPQSIPDAANNVPAAEVGVGTKVFLHWSDTGMTNLNATGNDNYPYVEADLGWGTTNDPTSATAAWTWAAGSYNGTYVATDTNDEMVANLTATATGSYYYGWRMRLVKSDGTKTAYAYCDRSAQVTATPPASTNYGAATVRTGPATVSTQIAAAKAAADGTISQLIDGAVVTYIRTFAGDFQGFFVQAETTGPGLWVRVDPSTLGLSPALAVGDKISFTATAKTTSSGVKEITSVGSTVTRISSGNSVSALTTDLTAATDTVTALSTYEFRMVKATGTIATDINIPAGAGYAKAQFDTTGISGATNTLQRARFPTAAVRDAMGLVNGCVVTITAPLWRSTTEAQFTGWATADVTVVSCPAPRVLSAVSNSAFEIVVTFDRPLLASSLLANGSQFSALPALGIYAATLVAPNQVKLTTGVQAAVSYSVAASGNLKDLYNTVVDTTYNTATVTGTQGGTTCTTAPQVVISQVYGGGGNTGALYKNDFVELYNRGSTAVSLAGWSIQYASATGTFGGGTSPLVTYLTGSIQPHSYYLIQEAAGTGTAPALPTADVITSGSTLGSVPINMSGTTFKLALVSSTTLLTGTCPTSDSTVADFVGAGTANCYEGTALAPAPSNSTSIKRNAAGCEHLGDSSLDFVAGVAPDPRNSASPTASCACP